MFKLKPWQAAVARLTGIWLVVSSFLLDASAPAIAISDRISGAAVLGLSAVVLRSKGVRLQWALAVVALWLLAAPLILWAPTALAYLNDTVGGLLILTVSVILPYSVRTGGPETSPDWSYNPSSWSQRLPIILIGFIAYVAATHLTFFQLHYIDRVWDPFFGDGTRRVLTSDISKAFPVSDAGLGAFAYLLECVSGLIGDNRRWRTMPWMSMLFWILVVPAGVVSIVLVMLQPIAVGAWCALCLLTATLTLVTVPPAMDEFILTAEFLLKRRREGKNIWKLFWLGEVDSSAAIPVQAHPGVDLSLPWNLVLSVILGIGLMLFPNRFQLDGLLANSHYMTGAMVITFAIIGMAEVGRPFRLLNLLFGAWAAVAPWFLVGASSTIRGADAIAGLLIGALALPRGKLKDRHGAWDRILRKW